MTPTRAKTVSGRNVWLETIWPARDSSTKPTMAASEVPLMSCTRKPMVAGSEILKACGRTTSFMREM